MTSRAEPRPRSVTLARAKEDDEIRERIADLQRQILVLADVLRETPGADLGMLEEFEPTLESLIPHCTD